jgi:hypothetical protein
MRLNTTLSTLLLVFCWILCSTTAFAQATFRWNSSSGTNWQDSGNWIQVGSGTDDGNNGYPDGLDEALFDASSPIPSGALTNTPASVAKVTLNGFTGTVQIGEDLTCDTLTIATGTLQIIPGFDLTVNDTTTINGGTLTLNDPDNEHSLGGFALSSGTFNGPSSGSVQLTSATISGGTFNGNGGNGGEYTIDANQQLAISGGTFNAGNGTYNLSINQSNANIIVFDRTGGTFNRGTSSFSVDVRGSGTRTATLSTNTTTEFHNLTITSNTSGGITSRTVNFAGGGTFTIHNELTRAGGLGNVTVATGTTLQYASGATLKYSNTGTGSLNVSGEWPSSSGPTNVIKQGSNTITLTDSRTIPLGGVLQIDAGIFTISSVTLTVNGALRRNVGGLGLINSGTLTYGTTGTQTVNGKSYTGAVLWYSAGVPITIGPEFPTSVPNLLITTSDTVKGSANRTVQGIFRMQSGTLDLGSNTLTVQGDISGSEVAGIAVIANSTTLNLGGGSTSTLAQTISGNLTLNKLTIDKQATGGPWAPSNTVTVSAGASITFTANGTLTIQNGTLSFGSSSVLVATNLPTLTLNISSNGILKTGGQNLDDIGGSFTVSGKIVFNGTNTETLPRNRTIARIEIDNSNNVQVSNASNNTVTVTDSLIFTSGRITQTDSTNYLFVLESGCKVSGSGYVDGPVRRVFTGTGEGIVPTGRSTGSSPSANWITLNFSQVNFSQGSNSATLRFEQINGDIGGPTSGNGWSARSTTRYWRIQVVSGNFSSLSYGITVQKANSGIATPRGRILRSSAVPATSSSFETSFASPQIDNGTTVATPNNAYADFQPAFTIVRDATDELIWRGGQDQNNSWHLASNWWLPTGLPSSSPPTSNTSVIINGARPNDLNIVDGDATVRILSPAVCQSLTVGDTTGATTSTLEIAATLNVGSGYNPANTIFGQNSTIVWKDGSDDVQADAYQNLTVDNNSALSTQGTGSITVSGNMVKQGSGTFTPASGNAITVSGNYTNTAGNADYSNASLTLNTGGTTFTLTNGTVSGTVTLAAQNIQLNGGTMSANLTINGTGTQTISGTGTTSLAGLTVTNGIEVNLGGQTRTVVGNVALNNSVGKITNGTLRMAGTGTQTISGSGSGTVANLEVSNSSGVTLNRALKLTDTLKMTNGNLNTTTTNILTATATSGGSFNSFVNGPLQIGQVGTATASYPKRYPVGNGVYRPFQITVGPNANTVQRVQLINSSPLDAGATLGGGLSAISAFRYWELTDNTGDAAGTQAGDTVVLGYVQNPVDDGINNLPPDPLYPLRVAACPTLGGVYSPYGGTDIDPFLGVRGVQSNTSLTTGLRFYTLGSVNASDAPLPVELISFAITAVDEGVKLKWETASEVENAGFILSRSRFRDGGFEELASYRTHEALVGKGTSATGGKYEWIDKSKLLPGETYYYKLEDVDFNGVIHTTQIKEFVMPKEYSLSQNYPNPFNSSTVVEFNLRMPGRTVLEVYNVLGQRVMTVVDGELSAGSYRYQVNLSGLASGMYLYRLRSRDFVATKKMLLIK